MNQMKLMGRMELMELIHPQTPVIIAIGHIITIK